MEMKCVLAIVIFIIATDTIHGFTSPAISHHSPRHGCLIALPTTDNNAQPLSTSSASAAGAGPRTRGSFRSRPKRYPGHYHRFNTALPQGPLIISGLSIFQNALHKFRSRPGTYLLIPVVAAGVGWLTNWLAVQMIFYPIEYRGLSLYRWPESPLGVLGWQGIVPCKTRKMSATMVTMVTQQLLSVPEAFARLEPEKVANLLAPEIPGLVNEILSDVLPRWMTSLPTALYRGLDSASHRVVQYFTRQFLVDLTRGLQANIDQVLSLQDCVVSQMLQDRTRLGVLFRKCGQRELDFLVNSGLWFGFLLGIIQMMVALVWDNPWSLSIGGGIVGLATNWLALKWIFEPVDPLRIGPLTLQGMFLRRQPEVAREFSQFFANNILTAEQLWKSVLTNPNTLPSFGTLFQTHFSNWARKLTRGFGFALEPETLKLATAKALSKLPDHVHVLYPYMDQTLKLEATLHEKMLKMSPRQFERVLHPIFEEDELTLILAGAVLGFAAGFIQQGLETGAISIPKIRDFVVAFARNPKQQATHVLRSFRERWNAVLLAFKTSKQSNATDENDNDGTLSTDKS